MKETLSFFGFGNSIIKWFNVLYNDIVSCIQNNGHLSPFFSIQRGVRQGDPLSPYLFILSVELLSAALKNNPNIKGIKINNSEYLISQYADDSTLTLEDDEISINSALISIENFAKCSGLKANFDKTTVLWIGAKRGCGEEIRTVHPISWNHNGVFKLLGITFNMNEKHMTLNNFPEGLKKIKNLLSDWSFRNLSVNGKIVVIKTLALPILVQYFTSLEDPPDNFFHEIQLQFFKFLWDGKPDKIKRNVIIGPRENGLNLPHIKSFCHALKLTWMKRLIDVSNSSPWKILFVDKIEKIGGENFWFFHNFRSDKVMKHLTPFWKNIFSVWAHLQELTATPKSIQSELLWLNPKILVNNKPLFKPNWLKKGIKYINDLIDVNGSFLYLDSFRNKFDIQSNFLEYNGIITAIKSKWKNELNNIHKEQVKENKNIAYLKSKNKPSKCFYPIFLAAITEEPVRIKEKWSHELDLAMDAQRWKEVFNLPYNITHDTKLQSFQFKLLHRILPTNSLLMKCNLVASELCTFCHDIKETLLHLFCTCSHSVTIWRNMELKLRENCNIEVYG